MITILAVSFSILLAVFITDELFDNNNELIEWAESRRTLGRLKAMKPILDNLPSEQRQSLFELASSCLSGHAVTKEPFVTGGHTDETHRLQLRIADLLKTDESKVLVGHATIKKEDFEFGRCRKPETELPSEGIVISVQLNNDEWFHKEVHRHWHSWYVLEWVLRTSALFFFIGAAAIFLIRRLIRPLDQLTAAAQTFGRGLHVSKLEEKGPSDIRRAIAAFNAMQQQVTDEVKKRTDTLAAISHDVRTPLTALRIKAELIDDTEARQDLITSIDRMEKITVSALEFLKGESRGEPLREIDLSALLESECNDFEEMGHSAKFFGASGILHYCRPEALARAVRNLIENAIKYGGSADVRVEKNNEYNEENIVIKVSDHGPGIPLDKLALAVEPFERLSKARENNKGGFGLGLSVAKAIAEGHDGQLILEANQPSGLIATIQLPTKT